MNIYAVIKITDIDYEATLKNCYPYLMENMRKYEKTELIFRLLEKLGEDALTFLFRFTGRFSVEEKNRLVAIGFNAHEKELTGKITEYLKENKIGQAFEVSRITIRQRGTSLVLFLENVLVDAKLLLEQDVIYDKLVEITSKKLGVLEESAGKIMKSGFTKSAASLAMHIASDTVEERAFAYINKKETKEKLIHLAQDAMQARGIMMTLSELEMEEMREDIVDMEPVEMEISEELLEHLLEELSIYMKELLKS